MRGHGDDAGKTGGYHEVSELIRRELWNYTRRKLYTRQLNISA